MKRNTGITLGIMTLACIGLLSLPMNADAGRFRGGNTVMTQAATQAQPMYQHVRAGNGPGPGFVDADGDGINDNFVDADGDGICDNTGLPVGIRPGMGNGGQGMGVGFVDADGDGICDLRQ